MGRHRLKASRDFTQRRLVDGTGCSDLGQLCHRVEQIGLYPFETHRPHWWLLTAHCPHSILTTLSRFDTLNTRVVGWLDA